MARHEEAPDQHERRPLLSEVGDEGDVLEEPASRAAWSRRRLIASSALVLITAVVGAAFVNPAMNQLVEGAACQQLHPNVKDWYHDKVCKSPDVQDRLAMIMGWEVTYALIPALATAIPYGVFTDRHGPKAMSFLVGLGAIIVQVGELATTFYPHVFDLRGIWLSSFIGNLVGGGPLGMEAMQYTIADLIATESNRAEVFFYMICLLQVTFIVSGPFVYWAMNTTEKKAARDHDDVKPASVRHAFLRTVTSVRQAVSEFLKLFGKDTQLALLLLSLIFSTIGVRQALIRQQYATNRYGWTWAKAGAMISLISTVSLFVLVVFVPAVSRWLLKRTTSFGKDLWISKIGILALFIGSILIGLAKTPVQFIAAQAIYSLDMCYTPAITSVIAALAGSDNREAAGTGLVYMTVVFMRMIGSLVAGPVVFGVFRVGLSMGGDWIGLPFFFEAALQVFTVAITFSVQERKNEEESADASSDP
ncbi:hypothetical protein NLG97_g4952 [Lecanicillium saksenae]|uniref:Uncharacterized protein n=1 Tax=Lecanicillium saksenae TaxID=468837 RepID=A0ACC1QWC2_9HYPO|nr:hypothetical protein NLG97_g4952 [Lecanicillium saksenae]